MDPPFCLTPTEYFSIKFEWATYSEIIRLLNKDVKFFEELVDKVCAACNNVSFLKKLANFLISYLSRIDSKRRSTSIDNDDNLFVGGLVHCKQYSGIISRVYDGIFACHKPTPADHQYERRDDEDNAIYMDIVTDQDLLCIFLLIVALKKGTGQECARNYLISAIFASLDKLECMFKSNWSKWPFTRLVEGNQKRDELMFEALFGCDFRDGRKNCWVSISKVYEDILNKGFSEETDDETWRPTIMNRHRGDPTMHIEEGPVSDLFQCVPPYVHHILFGDKLAQILQLCYNYSSGKILYTLSSDTHPVRAEDFPAIIPSGCKEGHELLLPTNNLTLVSRHAIPSTRKLGFFLLNRDFPLPSLERSIAECMINYSLIEGATIYCPESEIQCIERHISFICDEDRKERCGLCDEELTLDFFPLHAFMDTFEATNNCSTSLCPDCTIHHVLLTYQKVTSTCTAITEAFKCPYCGEFMVNWLGRGLEFSLLCQNLFSKTKENDELKRLVVMKMEKYFSSLEILQSDFMATASPSSDYVTGKGMLLISDPTLRPPIKKYKLMEGDTTNRYSLCCVGCLSPLCCDKPDDADIETVDDPNHVNYEYDNGPGTHRWPSKLSCGFVVNNEPHDGKEIGTSREAIAFLNRMPWRKDGRNIQTYEGKAVVALANWYRTNYPPTHMRYILSGVPFAYAVEGDSFSLKARYQPFLPEQYLVFLITSTTLDKEPLIQQFWSTELSEKQDCQEPLTKFANLLARNTVSENLLQMPECIYHRSNAFVLDHANPEMIKGKRADEAARLEYVKLVNTARRSGATENIPISYTKKKERTIEWLVEGDGLKKIVTCYNCRTPAIKIDGCVSVKCTKCNKVYCWLCEKPYTPLHTSSKHRLLYTDDGYTKRLYEEYCGFQIASLKPYKFWNENEKNWLTLYVMEDGFTFDTSSNRAVSVVAPLLA